ncbi:MAG: sigma-70 family RNA polymerase sigma factor [Maricaulaceae bacterium]
MTSSLSDHPTGLDREHAADLLEAVAQRQDRAAFAELFGYYAPRVKSYLMRLGAAESVAEELTQDVMATLWRKAAQFDRALASVSTWVFRIARNRRIDVLRQDRRAVLDFDDPALYAEPEPQPDEALSAAERETRVRAALTDLPEDQVALLRLAFFEGRTHAEIAETTGIALGTVKSRLRLAFGKLRKKLDGEL